MQFRQMRHFIVVAEELHMHRAAERLNMAQPALSQQVKALEERLGVTLFSRANRRLTLTPAGEAFLVKARLAISLTEQAVLDARQTARGEQGVLNLGCVSSAMFDGKLPAVLRQMHTRWPAITMSLMTGNVQTLYAAVQSNQLDVAIIRAPLPPLPSLPEDLQSRPFTREKTVLALYRQHPLAGSAALTLSSVKDEKWISLRDPEGMGLEQYFYDACSGSGFQPDVVQNATDVPTVISLVSAGFGLALLPASAKAVSVENVVYVDILDRLRESELTLICHRIIRSEVLKKFLTTLDRA
ncbi:LysR family transcriptional regulator [Enterobacter chengduensis]|uniref:LysR substrate-binding domain-containing protein n=1 Tax=Enterobacter chengduensis TaxID=2494701 RepID=UPI000F68E9B6|nr:LysR substrate-binding domain-containing protein [Enterobacter chengduensis]RSK60044.1 LysR family transcriptional regulator [Enterobacter chengduensis]